MATKSSLPPGTKADLIKRLRSVRGQVDGVLKMIEDDRYCVDVLRQIAAVTAALDRIAKIELKNHLEHCYTDAIRSGHAERAHAEVAELLGLTKV